MSTIFNTTTTTLTKVEPRLDATIRISYYAMPAGSNLHDREYRSVRLLEFHPDFDERAKFRSTAYVKPEAWMEHPAYERCGDGFLAEDQVYVSVREFMIHEEDRRELMSYCAKYLDHGTLLIYPCKRPFPIFHRGARVVVIQYKTEYDDTSRYAGQRGKIISSSRGGRSEVLLESGERIGSASVALREEKKYDKHI